jgi:hypothetical protein
MTKGESFIHSNTGDGAVNQAVYIFSGDITAVQNEQNISLNENELTDISSLKNKPIQYTAGNAGATWVAINPAPATKRFNTQLINTEQTLSVTGSNKETFVLCIEGVITCEGKQLGSLQYVRVLDGRTVSVSVPNNSVAVILTEQ